MGFDFATWQIVVILAIYGFAGTAKGITGLGFSTVCLPFLTIIVGLKEALPLVIIPSIASNLVVMHSAGRVGETLGRFWPMLVATVPGLILGLWALSVIDGKQAGGVLGLMLVLWCLFSLAKPNVRIPANLEKSLAPFSGFLTGVINGVTGSQVMPSVPYLMMLQLERNLFLQATNCSFTMSSFIMAIGLSQLGLFSSGAVLLSALGVVFAYFGVKAGERVRLHLSPDLFRIAVLLMLIVMGLSLLAQAF